MSCPSRPPRSLLCVRPCSMRRAVLTALLIALGLAVHVFLSRNDRLDADTTRLFSFLVNSRVDDKSAVPAEGSPGNLGLRAENPQDRDSLSDSQRSCSPQTHVVFLKTHKTGSSTIQNILFRYGDSSSLTFALPRGRIHRFSYPALFRSEFVERLRGSEEKPFHIICSHMRFRKSEVAKVMPEDSFYFSILRHPVAMMESMFIYFSRISSAYKSHNLDSYLDKVMNDKTSASNGDFAHNILAFDLGQDNRVTADSGDLEERAAQAIASIQRDFHLLLINEYFDESMILLRHALCWSLDDVVSFKLNSRSDKSRIPVSPETAEKTKRWNALDWRIYLHFNATFWEKVRSLGEELVKREVSELRKLRAQLTETCLRGGQAVDPGQIKDAGLKPFQGGAAVVLGYNLNPDLDAHTAAKCRQLILPELQYTMLLYNRQFQNRGGAK